MRKNLIFFCSVYTGTFQNPFFFFQPGDLILHEDVHVLGPASGSAYGPASGPASGPTSGPASGQNSSSTSGPSSGPATGPTSSGTNLSFTLVLLYVDHHHTKNILIFKTLLYWV
jgi:hypothetical protein